MNIDFSDSTPRMQCPDLSLVVLAIPSKRSRLFQAESLTQRLKSTLKNPLVLHHFLPPRTVDHAQVVANLDRLHLRVRLSPPSLPPLRLVDLVLPAIVRDLPLLLRSSTLNQRNRLLRRLAKLRLKTIYSQPQLTPPSRSLKQLRTLSRK